MRRPRALSVVGLAIAALIAAVAILLISGRLAIVVTHGVSMSPVYHENDLVIVADTGSYAVGDIVAYRLPSENTAVLHRIIGGDASGFRLKGDNNESLDPTTPTADQIMGRAVLHIPQGGVILNLISSPPVIGLVAFALIAAGGVAASRNRRGRQRRSTVPSSDLNPSLLATLRAMPPSLRTFGLFPLLLALTGITLGGLAWTGPTKIPGTERDESAPRMAFSYSAGVEPSAAYDSTTVSSPDPLFRTVVDRVDLNYSYRGEPGILSLTAELSAQSGWRSTVSLDGQPDRIGNRHDGTVELNLAALQERADAAAQATGMPTNPLSVSVTAAVRTGSGELFEPTVTFAMSPSQFALITAPADLVVTGSPTATDGLVSRTISFFGVSVTAMTARTASVAMLALAVLGSALLLALARRRNVPSSRTAIDSRYEPLLTPVKPIATLGASVIDVANFVSLAKLAERYGSVVLHWEHDDAETFVVQDQGVSYRYCRG